MTKREAAILSVYTDVVMCEWPEIRSYIEEKIRRPIQSLDELRSDKIIWEEIMAKCRLDFMDICNNLED